MLSDIIQERLKKRRTNYYPAKTKRTCLIGRILGNFEELLKKQKSFWVAGRLIGLRVQGGLMFWDIQDATGKIQVVAKQDNLKNFSELKDNVDIGDFIETSGILFVTNRGEKSVEAKRARIIVKSIRPLPSVWHGLKDVEERFRKRYLDFLLNPQVKENIIQRLKIIESIRGALRKEGFLEVETPILQAVPGGAMARPFITHHNALDVDFYLRVAPELYLKRLLVGGFEKIFEIGRNFRNEGIDRDHNPEFTMLELYWAYQDYRGLMKFVQKLLKKWIPGEWETTTFKEVVKKISDKDCGEIDSSQLDDFFKKEIRPKITKPTFVIEYPETIMPLAKLKEKEPSLTESFQLIVNGVEIVKGFSELNDPVVQRSQMEKQEKEFRAGKEEASRLDEDFLEAMEYGMPPAAGLGLGIDRLAALVTGAHSIKEIIAFPTLKPKQE